MADRSTASSHIVGATILGGMLGAGLTLLFAPRSGKETRAMIQQNAESLKQQANDRLTKLKGSIKHTTKKAQSPVLSAWEEEV